MKTRVCTIAIGVLLLVGCASAITTNLRANVGRKATQRTKALVGRMMSDNITAMKEASYLADKDTQNQAGIEAIENLLDNVMETIRQNRKAVDAKYTADLAEITRKRDTGKNDTAASNAKAEKDFSYAISKAEDTHTRSEKECAEHQAKQQAELNNGLAELDRQRAASKLACDNARSAAEKELADKQQQLTDNEQATREAWDDALAESTASDKAAKVAEKTLSDARDAEPPKRSKMQSDFTTCTMSATATAADKTALADSALKDANTYLQSEIDLVNKIRGMLSGLSGDKAKTAKEETALIELASLAKKYQVHTVETNEISKLLDAIVNKIKASLEAKTVHHANEIKKINAAHNNDKAACNTTFTEATRVLNEELRKATQHANELRGIAKRHQNTTDHAHAKHTKAEKELVKFNNGHPEEQSATMAQWQACYAAAESGYATAVRVLTGAIAEAESSQKKVEEAMESAAKVGKEGVKHAQLEVEKVNATVFLETDPQQMEKEVAAAAADLKAAAASVQSDASKVAEQTSATPDVENVVEAAQEASNGDVAKSATEAVAVVAEKPIEEALKEKTESTANDVEGLPAQSKIEVDAKTANTDNHEEAVKQASDLVDEEASKHVTTRTRQIEEEFDACNEAANKALQAAKDAATLERETILKANDEKNRLLDSMYTDSVAAISEKRKDAQEYLDSEAKMVESIRELLVQLKAKAPVKAQPVEEEKPHTAYTSLNEHEEEHKEKEDKKPCKTCVNGKACGDSCISKDATCNKAPGCAVNAE
jgi:hypothetical protein